MVRGLRMPGVYGALLERQRELTRRGDPRRVLADPADAGGGFYGRSTVLLRQLEAGQPVTVPVWRLGGNTVRRERIRELKRGDCSITAWIVHRDDTVMPVRTSR